MAELWIGQPSTLPEDCWHANMVLMVIVRGHDVFRYRGKQLDVGVDWATSKSVDGIYF